MSSTAAAISLGNNCQPRYHVQRVFGRLSCPSSVFDWQETPGEAVLAYLERDFRGCFERADLAVDNLGVVRNQRLGTRHPHEFPGTDIDGGFAAARSRHDHLCGSTRAALAGNRPLVIATTGFDAEQLAQIAAALRRYNAGLRFTLIDGPASGQPTYPGTPRFWQGNHADWDAALAPVRHLVPNRSGLHWRALSAVLRTARRLRRSMQA